MRYVIFLWLLIGSAVFCTPSIYGPTGLIEIPSALPIEYKKINASVDYVSARVFSGDNTSPNVFYKFNFGSFENWELGILSDSLLERGVLVNMKYFLISDQTEYPLSFAAGIQQIGSKNDMMLYLVTSKRLSGGMTLHFGFRSIFWPAINTSLMGGSEYYVTENLSIMAEIMSDKDKRYGLNVGVKMMVYNDVFLRIHALDAVTSQFMRDIRFTVGVSIAKFI